MRVKVMLHLSRDEVQKQIPYAMICETRFGKSWNTMKRKRLWVEQFTEAERKHACELFKQAHLWYLVKGVPESIMMYPRTLHLWQRLGEFCASV